jgi:predicted RNA-binding Zn ribbon-like protein
MAIDAEKHFQLVAGDITLDLVNTLDFRFRQSGAVELLETYDDLLAFLTQSGLLTASQARKLRRLDGAEAERRHILKQVKDLRETLSTVIYALVDGDTIPAAELTALEACLKQASVHRYLVVHENHLAWSRQGTFGTTAAPLWLLAQAAADLLLSERAAQLRTCAADTCRWLFLDASKNRTRRWCDMKVCGNRMKAKRFQARRLSS